MGEKLELDKKFSAELSKRNAVVHTNIFRKLFLLKIKIFRFYFQTGSKKFLRFFKMFSTKSPNCFVRVQRSIVGMNFPGNS